MWDTIVIGAGIGGLTAAARLVKAGKHVLVLERNPHIGGTAYVYHRKNFTFPMGPLGFSNPGRVKAVLEDLEQDSDFTCDRVHYCLRAFNLTVMLSRPFLETIEELTRCFPTESAAIRRFFLDVEAFVSSPQFLTGTAGSEPISQISVGEYLSKITRNQSLQAILGSLGTSKPYASFPLQAAQWHIMSRDGIWYPRGGFPSFCDRLAKAVTGNAMSSPLKVGKEKEVDALHSGVIRLSSEVERISVDRGRVAGVVLADGTSIPTASVISNADYRSTFLRLLGSDVSPDWYHAVAQAKQSSSLFQVCLGVDSSRVDLSMFNRASRIIYRRNHGNGSLESEVDWNSEQIDPNDMAAQEIEVSCWSKDDASLASGGGVVLVVRTEAPYAHFARFRLGFRSRISDYSGYKTTIAGTLINEVEGLIPGLKEAISIIDVATPLTFADQGARSQGTVAGWSWDYQDSHDSGFRELVLTPIKGLYMAGYQAFSALFLGGVPTAMESGCRAADYVLQDADPINTIAIPGAY